MPPALGLRRLQGVVRQFCDDFQVVEIPSWSPTGDGEHQVLWVEKVDANTDWVARALARHAGVAPGAVSYAGRKDRAARTWQWFSVQTPGKTTDWSGFDAEGVTIHQVERHSRKIRTGSLKGNRFTLRVRDLSDVWDADLVEKLSAGFPNYFGPQRFGRFGSNLEKAQALAGGARLRRNERSMAISAARSAAFNHVLATRVQNHTWQQPLRGDVLQLEGSRSVFVADEAGLSDLRARADRRDVHPTGPLCGRGQSLAALDALELETAALAACADWVTAAERAGAETQRRSLRVLPAGLSIDMAGRECELSFELAAGSFATALLNELLVDVENQRSST